MKPKRYLVTQPIDLRLAALSLASWTPRESAVGIFTHEISENGDVGEEVKLLCSIDTMSNGGNKDSGGGVIIISGYTYGPMPINAADDLKLESFQINATQHIVSEGYGLLTTPCPDVPKTTFMNSVDTTLSDYIMNAKNGQ